MLQVEVTAVYLRWINRLPDPVVRGRIQVRVDRMVHGNPGHNRFVGNGVYELKIDIGPGYRVYYTRRGQRLIVLLAGGDKSSQSDDIARAIELCRGLEKT